MVKEKLSISSHLTNHYTDNYKYIVSNKKVISVNKKGIITAKKAGVSKIYVYSRDNQNTCPVATINIRVLKPLLTPISLTHPGQTIALSNDILGIPSEKKVYWSIIKGSGKVAVVCNNELIGYSDAAEPPVRCGVSHLSGQT
ncbi:MAG: hypothetical protein ILP14_09695 [Oscillospiraceae bacterium]|nr:hypothetical protein [Oscillospiraceae bacterium]